MEIVNLLIFGVDNPLRLATNQRVNALMTQLLLQIEYLLTHK